MKTLRTIAAVMIAVALVFGPTMAFAAGETVTVSTNASYFGQSTIQVTGTVTPAPTVSSTAVVVTTRGPAGAVDTGPAVVATGTGAYTYVFVSGSQLWVTGTYTVNATYGGPGGTGSAITTFTYQTGTTGGTTTVTVTSTVTSGVSTVTSSDAPALATITADLAGIQSSLNILTTSIGTITTGLTTVSNNVNALSGTLSSIQSAVNTANQGITGLQSSITSSTSGFGALAGVPAQVTALTTAVNNNQTYVLVVAALAAITLVLELAILVRKLS
jgi:hypothetical protein